MTFPNPLRSIAGFGIAAATTLGAAPLASAAPPPDRRRRPARPVWHEPDGSLWS